MSEDNNNAPRQPNNYQALLKFALEATASEDAKGESEYQEMDPERKQFLQDALSSLTLNIVEELTKAMKILQDLKKPKEDQLEALDVVCGYVEDIDSANDFFKINGFCIILPCLNSPHKEVRSETANLIATLAQNNPYCQKHLLELLVIPKLIELLSDDPIVGYRAMRALSCLVRNYEPALASFIDIGGLECILGCLQYTDEKMRIKSIFLLSGLCTEMTPVRDEFIKLDAIERVITSIVPSEEYNEYLELAMGALNVLVETKESILRSQNSQLKLREKLENVLRLSDGKEECQDQKECCQILLKKCFGNGDFGTDR